MQVLEIKCFQKAVKYLKNSSAKLLYEESNTLVH